MKFRGKNLFTVKSGEWRPLLWSVSYFFSLLCGYYIIRPMRDEMGITGGVEHLQWMFSGTFVAMLAAVPLFGWLTRRFAPRRFLPYVYYFFITNLIFFFLLFKSQLAHVVVARAFFIWASVFNLFIVSVFWSFMTDIYTNAQARRLFGVIAAGGTAGALTGPVLTAFAVVHLGTVNLLVISAAFLAWALLCIHRLCVWKETSRVASAGQGRSPATPGAGSVGAVVGGSVLAGVRLVFRSSYLAGICLLMLLFSTLATFLYFQQAHIIEKHFEDPALRTALFAAMDFSVNALTLIAQIFFTGRIIERFGLGWALSAVPLVMVAGFTLMSVQPALWVVVAVQVIRRAGNYALMRPGREMLYVILSKEEKYKAKNFIDTVVYRGGDAVSAWIYAAMQALGLSLGGIALAAVPAAGAWAWISFRMGKWQERMAADAHDGPRRPSS